MCLEKLRNLLFWKQHSKLGQKIRKILNPVFASRWKAFTGLFFLFFKMTTFCFTVYRVC